MKSDESSEMSNFSIQPVILCGGAGTRLWPLSRAGFPKQFLCLTGDDSSFQQAARRLAGLVTAELHVAEPIVVCNEDHRFLVLEQLRETNLGLGVALLEPAGRNTAPALTLAALAAMSRDDDPVLVVTPADQNIIDQPAFNCSVRQRPTQFPDNGLRNGLAAYLHPRIITRRHRVHQNNRKPTRAEPSLSVSSRLAATMA